MRNNYNFKRRQQYFFHLLLEGMIKSNDPFWKKVNISHIKMNKNFRSCQIFYTIFGPAQILNDNVWSSKIAILKKIVAPKWLGYTLPDLNFVYDKNLIEAEKIIDIFTKIKNEEKTS